jgi:L-glyceraldehyde 3-phosphate reductase
MNRYESMQFRRTGQSGLKLPAISLGLWNNFGHLDDFQKGREIVRTAFDSGITHFDLANNYGPPAGSAEENFGKMLSTDLAGHRDELVISSKAGYRMWPGPYGDGGSRKYLAASLDQSLQRMKLDYVDIFYSHRFDSETPLEETMGALDAAVRAGKALYVGISSYSPEKTAEAARILRELGTPCLIHQPSYSILNRGIERALLNVLDEQGMGCIAFCPLDQGVLTTKYLGGIPEDSRAGKSHGSLSAGSISEEKLAKVRQLNDLAQSRGQSLAQMSLAWVLRHSGMTSALIGASKPQQITDCVGALQNLEFSEEELGQIDAIAPRPQ